MLKRLIAQTTEKGTDAAEAYLQKRSIEKISFQNNRLHEVTTKAEQGVHLRVVKDGKSGTIASSDWTQTDRMVAKVLEITEYGDSLGYELNLPGLLYPEVSMLSDRIYEISTEELIARAEGIIREILDYDPKVQVVLQIERTTEHREICNSHGLAIAGKRSNYSAFAMGFLVEGDNFVNAVVILLPRDGMIDYSRIAGDLIEKLKLARVTVSMKSGKYPVIFTPNAIAQIADTFEGMKGSTVAKGISPLQGQLGTRIFDEKLTIIDDGTYPQGLHSDCFDDEGTPTQRTVLVEKGVLKSYIHSLRSAAETGMAPTGNGWKPNSGYSSSPNAEFTNLIIAPGDRSLEEMIRQIPLGLVIDDISGLQMGNVLQGNIDSDIDMAYKIEDGKLVGRVKNGAIGTNVYQIFKDHVVALENTVSAGIGDTGCVLTPHILCKDINITFG